MTVRGMRSAICAGVPVTILQRVGYVFEMLEFDSLADSVRRALPKHFPPALLQSHGKSVQGPAREPWGIIDNLKLLRGRQ
jgi:hypothetical protein